MTHVLDLSISFPNCVSLLQQARPNRQSVKRGCQITLVALAALFIAASICRCLNCPPVAVLPIVVGSALLASLIAWRLLCHQEISKSVLEHRYSDKLQRQREQIQNLKSSCAVLEDLFTLSRDEFDRKHSSLTLPKSRFVERREQLDQFREKWSRQKSVIARIISDWERSLEQGIPVSIPKWYHCSGHTREIVASGCIQPSTVPLFSGFEDKDEGLVCVSINIERRYGHPIALSEDIEGLAAPTQIGLQNDQSGADISAPGWFGIPVPIPLFNRSTDPVIQYNNHPVCFLTEEDTSVTSSSIKKIPSEALDVLHTLLRLHNEIPAEWKELPLWLRTPD